MNLVKLDIKNKMANAKNKIKMLIKKTPIKILDVLELQNKSWLMNLI